MSKNIGIGTLFVKIGQNGKIQCFMIGRQPGNRAWPITSNLDACGIMWALTDHFNVLIEIFSTIISYDRPILKSISEDFSWDFFCV